MSRIRSLAAIIYPAPYMLLFFRRNELFVKIFYVKSLNVVDIYFIRCHFHCSFYATLFYFFVISYGYLMGVFLLIHIYIYMFVLRIK